MQNKTKLITQGAMIAAVYVILTMVSRVFGLDSGAIQLRLSEALCILPCFTPAAIGGLFVGCILANLFAGAIVWDIVFGSIATLIGAIFSYRLRKKPILATIPPILANALIVPFVLAYAYHIEGAIWYFMVTVGLGEILSCGVLGIVLYKALAKHKNIFN